VLKEEIFNIVLWITNIESQMLDFHSKTNSFN